MNNNGKDKERKGHGEKKTWEEIVSGGAKKEAGCLSEEDVWGKVSFLSFKLTVSFTRVNEKGPISLSYFFYGHIHRDCGINTTFNFLGYA